MAKKTKTAKTSVSVGMALIIFGVTALVILYFLVMQVQQTTPAAESRAYSAPVMSQSDDIGSLEKDLLKLNSTTFEADYQQIMDY